MQTSRKRRPAFLLAFICSLLTGSAQLTIKWAADRLQIQGWRDPELLLAFVVAYGMLGLALIVLLLALEERELSTIYPLLAARYVWVVTLTPIIFPTESLNAYKITGASLAAAGVWAVMRGRE